LEIGRELPDSDPRLQQLTQVLHFKVLAENRLSPMAEEK
jgi:hypothetical protein